MNAAPQFSMIDRGQPALGMPAGPPLPFGGEGDVHILDRLGVLYKYRRLILSILVLVVGAGVVQTYTTQPMYEARARVELSEDRRPISTFQQGEQYSQDPEPFFLTQQSIMRSRDLARIVVRKLDLASRPEFNGRGVQPRGTRGLLVRARDSVSGLLGRRRAPAPAPASGGAVVDRFLSHVRIAPERNTRLVDIVFVSADPELAARAANALAEEYVKQNIELKVGNASRTLDFLSREIENQRIKVTQSEEALRGYRIRSGATALGNNQNTVTARLNSLSERYTQAQATRLQKETVYNQLKALGPETAAEADTFPVIAMNGSIQNLRGRLAQLQIDRLKLADRYGEKAQPILEVDKTIADARDRLKIETRKVIDSVRIDYEAALRDERAYAAQLGMQKQEASDLDRKSIEDTTLGNQVKTNRELYDKLITQQSELQILAKSKENNVRLVDAAEVPPGPYTPDVQRNLLIAIALGLGLGLGVALGLDYLDDTIKTPEDITNKLKLPFLGLVPAIRGDRTPLLSQSVPHDFGEAYRALRTALVFTSGAQSTRLVGVTSAQPLEGKTTTACNLAIALALGGARVLLIDADMRRPGVHRTMGLQNGIGLSHVLTGQARVREAVQRTDDPNLVVMTAGRTPPNPSELLSSNRMLQLLDNLEHGPFDWVLVDTPPVLAVTDAVILTQHMSGVVFVIGAEMTRRRLAERAIQMLNSSKPHVVGAVLNRVNFERNKYYYSRYYGYHYKSYYGQAAASA